MPSTSMAPCGSRNTARLKARTTTDRRARRNGKVSSQRTGTACTYPGELKFRCKQEQEFVIGGYTDPRGSRSGFGALLLGYYREGKLVYAGKVGTGFDQDLLRRLAEKLVRLKTPVPPFAEDGLPRRGVHWVKPKLVAQIGFTEWTAGGKLRHHRFIGLRDDKRPEDVVL